MQIKLPDEWKDVAGPFIDKKIVFGVRPEDIGSPEAESKSDASKIKAKVEVIEPMGAETYLYLSAGEQAFISRVDAHRKTSVGDDIELSVSMSKSHIFDQVTEKFII
jgi:multiple sugar transport system ATP-binding protein